MQEPISIPAIGEKLKNSIIIRQFQPPDQDSVFKIYKEALKDLGLLNENRSNPANFEEIQKTYLDNNGDFLVAEIDGIIVGTGGYNPDSKQSDTAVIRRMYTLPEYQHQGIGRKILAQLEGSIKQRPQYNQISLFTAKEMPNAAKLYISMGYTKAGKQPQDGFIFQKTLYPLTVRR
jgi:putative acetyltransferase